MLPENPTDLLSEIRAHYREAHQSASVTEWFDDCRACELLEARYAAALHEAA